MPARFYICIQMSMYVCLYVCTYIAIVAIIYMTSTSTFMHVYADEDVF